LNEPFAFKGPSVVLDYADCLPLTLGWRGWRLSAASRDGGLE
jgi:hypothetical protein